MVIITVRRGVSTLPFLEHPTLYWFSTPFLKYHPGTPFLMNHPLFNENPPYPPLFKPKFSIDQKLHETYMLPREKIERFILIPGLHCIIALFPGNSSKTKKGNLLGISEDW